MIYTVNCIILNIICLIFLFIFKKVTILGVIGFILNLICLMINVGILVFRICEENKNDL
jgi:hypothetical protein